MTIAREECNDSHQLKIDAVTGMQYYFNEAETPPPINEDYMFTYIIPSSIWDLDNIEWDDDKSELYNMLSPINTYIHKKFEEEFEDGPPFFQIGMYINSIRELSGDPDPYIMESYIVQGSRFRQIDPAIKQMEQIVEEHAVNFNFPQGLISSVYLNILKPSSEW